MRRCFVTQEVKSQQFAATGVAWLKVDFSKKIEYPIVIHCSSGKLCLKIVFLPSYQNQKNKKTKRAVSRNIRSNTRICRAIFSHVSHRLRRIFAERNLPSEVWELPLCLRPMQLDLRTSNEAWEPLLAFANLTRLPQPVTNPRHAAQIAANGVFGSWQQYRPLLFGPYCSEGQPKDSRYSRAISRVLSILFPKW